MRTGTAPTGASRPIRIGVAGRLALGSEGYLRARQLEADGMNAAGGIAGRQVKRVPGDAATPGQGNPDVHRDPTRENADAVDGTWSNGVAATVIGTTARYGKLNRDTNAFDNGLTRSIEHEGTFHRMSITIQQMAAFAQSARVIGTTVRRTLSDWGITVLLSSRTWSRPCRRRPGASSSRGGSPSGDRSVTCSRTRRCKRHTSV